MHDLRADRPADDSYLIGHALKPLWSAVDFYQDEATYEASLRGATPGQRALYACVWYLSEVKNGGHLQFFGNSTGMVWSDAIAGFRLFGAEQYAQILEQAVEHFPHGSPCKARARRHEQLSSIGMKAFEQLDDQLFALDKDAESESFFTAFIKEHPNEFFR